MVILGKNFKIECLSLINNFYSHTNYLFRSHTKYTKFTKWLHSFARNLPVARVLTSRRPAQAQRVRFRVFREFCVQLKLPRCKPAQATRVHFCGFYDFRVRLKLPRCKPAQAQRVRKC